MISTRDHESLFDGNSEASTLEEHRVFYPTRQWVLIGAVLHHNLAMSL